MCGIIGVLGKDTENKVDISRKMSDIIKHRGPDDDGFFDDSFVSLGMRRLSIIDLKTGSQPIENSDGTLLIFFNGEIYNYKELKADLEKSGFKFKTQTDTEVILLGYQMYGHLILSKLRGMFTFCIYDKNLNTIFLARDHFGIKPLYYLKKNNKILAFSSEIKSLLCHPDYNKKVNDSAVFNYLRFQYNPLQETFFKDIFSLQPGHFIKIDLFNESFITEKYFNFSFDKNRETDLELVKNKMVEIMEDSVRHHMIADVPVGSFLSGGIDSSIIAILMNKIRKGLLGDKDNAEKLIKTFNVGFDKISEENEAKETSDFIKTDHHQIKIDSKEYFENLEKAVWHFDEPVADPSAIGLYFLAKEAKKHVKVVLSGEGSDELYGGYNIYLSPIAYNKIWFIPKFILAIFTKVPFEFWGKNFLKRASSKLSDWYIGNANIFKKEEVERIWKGKKQELFSLGGLYDGMDKDLPDSEKMQIIDINTWLVGDILAKADKMTMAHSIELRVPFLDLEVYSLARKISPKFKWFKGITKYSLREAFKNLLPETTRNRKKLGFPTPIKYWLSNDKKSIYEAIISNTYIKENMDLDFIKKIIKDHLSGRVDNSRKIYILYILSLWYNIFFKSNGHNNS